MVERELQDGLVERGCFGDLLCRTRSAKKASTKPKPPPKKNKPKVPVRFGVHRAINLHLDMPSPSVVHPDSDSHIPGRTTVYM